MKDRNCFSYTFLFKILEENICKTKKQTGTLKLKIKASTEISRKCSNKSLVCTLSFCINFEMFWRVFIVMDFKQLLKNELL